VEPFLHAIPILCSLSFGVVLYSTDGYSPTGSICWIQSAKMQWAAAGYPIIVVFGLNCIFLTLIWWATHRLTSRSTDRRNTFSIPTHARSRRFSLISFIDSTNETLKGGNDEVPAVTSTQRDATSAFSHCGNSHQQLQIQEQDKPPMGPEIDDICSPESDISRPSSPSSEIDPNGPLAAYLSQRSRASLRRQSHIVHRATAYIIGYSLTYIFPLIFRSWLQTGSQPPFTIILLSRFFSPMQGFFNVLIYTYPHVKSVRVVESCSYLKALYMVVKSGGDSDQIYVGKRDRRNSMRRI